MRLPGPDHPITITENPKRVRVSLDGVVIAETNHALKLKEASYPAVQYVPRDDANMSLLRRTDRTTHCPYKGDASYYSVVADGVHVHDFHATILHLLGINHERLTYKHQGRYYRLTDVAGKVVKGILA